MKVKNKWLDDAAAGATMQSFAIRSVADFLIVPEHRRRVCLREFHSWLAIQESMTNLLCATSDALGTPIPREAVHWHNDVFTWNDDGKGTMSVRMVEEPRTVDAVDPHAGSTGTPTPRESKSASFSGRTSESERTR